MSMIAICMPILPGKKDKWQNMIDMINAEPMKSKIDASRKAAGVHERTFLQETPAGDMVIVTLEGNNPGEAFAAMMTDPAMAEFAQMAADVHGMSLDGPMPPPPKLVYDSQP